MADDNIWESFTPQDKRWLRKYHQLTSSAAYQDPTDSEVIVTPFNLPPGTPSDTTPQRPARKSKERVN